ncbi:TonB-dependent Receptor Plug Domain [Granulicella rosea]|uniref:TonB-dependent Receptor Plug Domain n=1 Tax=Granulicella rosea TaxID=474952 RepID=A0A239M1Q7_9BACT|nr:TonB-dependent receptor [Granulicella rosea]SNT36585.1 TonB-dependent Receptor Plug Domain [Granulicella rosea]
MTKINASSGYGFQSPIRSVELSPTQRYASATSSGAFARWLLILPLGLACFAPNLSAQVLYGTLTGSVTDPTGAAVPNANVRAVEIATGVEHTATTGETGAYSINDLNPGTYRVTVTAQGFSPVGQEGIALLANTTLRVNLTLKVGASTQEITVTDAAPMLQTETADTAYNISQQQIAELPTTSTTGRNFQSLYRLVPGSTPPAEQNSAGGNPQRAQAVNVNGVSNATNTTRIDGAVDAYPWLPYLVAYLPPTDGIESINVVTGSFNAEQGAAGGSAINVTMKSGTNHFHGSAWEFNTIAQYNAQAWSNRTGIRQKNIYNEVGGAIGGPIIKDKLFFFFDYNRVSVNKAINGIYSVPTLAMRGGDFSAFLSTTATSNTVIYDPATGTATGTGKTAFNGNKIDPSRFSPAAVKLLAVLPQPNYGAAGAATNNYFGTGVNAFLRENYDTKITYVPTQKTSFFGHYSISPNNITDPQVFGPNPGGGTFDGGQPGAATGRIQNIGLGATHAFTARLFMDANAGYTRQRLLAQAGDISLGDYGTGALGIPGTNYNGQSSYAGLPGFYFTTYASLGNANTGSPFLFRDNQYTGNVNLTWVLGKHSLRFGGEYLHAAINHFQPGTGSYATGRGSFQFTGGATQLNGGTSNNNTAAAAFADFLLGQGDTYYKNVQTFNPEPLRYSTFSFYGQDTYQVSSKLTLSYGVRYEYYPLPVGDHFGTVRYDPSIASTVTDSFGTHTVGTVLIGGKGANNQHAQTSNGWGMIVPRFGVSYNLNSKTVIRSGFGITTDPDTLRNLLQAYPSTVGTSVSGATSYVPADVLNAGLLSTATQVGIPTLTIPDISSGSLPLPTLLSTNTIPKNFRRGYIESFNLSVQRELYRGLTTNIAYVGTHAIRQQSSVNINAAPPGGGTAGRALNTTYGANTNNTDINSLLPFQGSVYNSLQTQLTKTSARHLSTGIVYTYSKAMDASDNSQASGLVFASPAYYYRNWGLAGYDRKHNFQWWTIYSLPFGKDQYFLSHGVVGYVVGGWKLSTTLSRVSGTPLTINGSSTFLNAPGNTQVADRVQGVTAVLGGRHPASNGYQYINPAAYVNVTTGPARFGNSSRGSVRGPGIFDLDVSLKRSFPIYKSIALDLVADSFDVTNTPQFANPAVDASSPSTFGVVTSSNVNRTMRFSGRISF